jgi:peptide/nickel transport system substrate-binding protein
MTRHRPSYVSAPTLALILALLVAVTACDTGREGTFRDDTVTIITLADISKPMPFISESVTDGSVVGMLYMSMLGSVWEDGRLRFRTADEDALAIARAYELFGPDSASLRYHMRSDLTWSDGEPLTAHDVHWTLETRGEPAVASPRSDYNRFIESVEVENDSTIVIHFTRRYPEMIAHTAIEIAPRHLYQDTPLAELRNHPALATPDGGNLVVSGPYMIGEWRRGQRFTLVPNPAFSPAPNIPRVVFSVIPEQTTRLIEFQTGNADVLVLPFDQIERVERSVPDMRLEVRRGRFYDYLGYNPAAHPALADPDVRRALGLAIDREGLIGALNLEGFAEPAGGPFSPIQTLHYDPEAQTPLPYDPTEAARILDEAGWVPGPGGVRARDGQTLSFNLSTNAGNQRRADIAQIVQQQWRQIGVEVRIQTRETNTFFDSLNRREYEVALAGWSIALFVDMTSLWEGDTPFNFTDFNDPEVSRLFALATEQPTEEAAAPYWKEAARLIVEQQPYSWLFYMDEVIGVRNRIQGTRIDALGDLQNLHEWYIDTDGG